MPDRLTPLQRSYCMSRIRSKNTGLENAVFSELRKQKIKFKKHANNILGKPDMAVIETKKAVFIDSDFWHGWRYPLWKSQLKTEFWTKKIESNRKRDKRVSRVLRKQGWKILRVWEHSLKNKPTDTIELIIAFMSS